MKNLMLLEKKKVASVANQYRRKGYTVISDVKKMPSFLKGAQVDMIAMSTEDNVLIEVVSQDSIKNRNKLETLAKLVQGKDKWRFEIIVTNPREEVRNDISLEQINERIEGAQSLHEAGHDMAALLLTWSAVEPIMRVIAEDEGIKARNRSPIQLTKTLYSMGSIGPSAYEGLIKAAKQRNNIAHGFEEEPSIDNHALVRELLKVTATLLSTLTAEISDDNKEDLTSDDLVEWFYEHYEDPANGVPYESAEGGYQYFQGGPYDPWEVLADEFSWIDDAVIEEAARKIYPNGHEWVEIGQY